MYVKFNEDGSYGFYTTDIHGEEIIADEAYKKIPQELYDEVMVTQGVKILTPTLELIDAPIEEFIESPPDLLQRLIYEEQKESVLSTCAIEDAIKLKEYYSEWMAGEIYSVGQRFTHESRVYEVIQDHKSQADWQPHEVPALYMDLENKLTQDGQLPTWRQPLEANDAYKKGDEVTHDGKNWRSTIDGNVWEPGIHGWEVLE